MAVNILFAVWHVTVTDLNCVSRIFSVYKRAFRRVYSRKIQVTSGIFNGYTTRKYCITILYHAIENAVASKASIICEICTDLNGFEMAS